MHRKPHGCLQKARQCDAVRSRVLSAPLSKLPQCLCFFVSEVRRARSRGTAKCKYTGGTLPPPHPSPPLPPMESFWSLSFSDHRATPAWSLRTPQSGPELSSDQGLSSLLLTGLAGRGGRQAASAQRSGPAPERNVRGPEPDHSQQLRSGPREVQYLACVRFPILEAGKERKVIS